MYLKKNGIEIQTLALPGGGTSAFSMYMGLLKDIDLDALTFDLVVSSAGALWFGEALCRKLQTNTESDERINRIKNIQKDILNVDLVSLLESEHETVICSKEIDTMREIYSCLDNIRIQDLKNLCNDRLIRFAVSEINEDTMLYEPLIIDETNSADMFVFDVILASCSLPLIFPSVSLKSYPKNMLLDKFSLITIQSNTSSFLIDLDLFFCTFMFSLKPSMSTLKLFSLAINDVRSTGNPKVS